MRLQWWVLSALLVSYVGYKLGWSRENLGLDDAPHRINLACVAIAALDAVLAIRLALRPPSLRAAFAPATLRWLFQGVVLSVVLAIVIEPLVQETPWNVFRLGLAVLLGVALSFLGSARLRAAGARLRRRRWSRIADLVLFNACAALVLLELGARLLPLVSKTPFTLESLSRADARIATYRPASGTEWMGFPVNSLGFVDREFQVEKPADTLRILSLGDSFSVGVVPYGDNFLRLLEGLLDQRAMRAKRHVEVYNMGIPGISPIEYAHLLRTEGMQFKPDVVLVNFFVGNDFLECRLSEPTFAQRFRAPSFLKRLITVLGERWRESPAGAEWKPGGAYYEEDTPYFSEAAHFAIENERIGICRVPMSTQNRTLVASARQALDEIVSMAPRVILVAIPDEFQVSAPLREAVLARAGKDARDFDFELPQKILAEYTRERGLPFIDLLPTMIAAEQQQGRTYKPRDTHFNRLGNRITAATIADAMVPLLAGMMEKMPAAGHEPSTR